MFGNSLARTYSTALYSASHLLTPHDRYPTEENPGSKAPLKEPRDGDGDLFYDADAVTDNTTPVYSDGTDTTSTLTNPYTFPGCPDKFSGLDSALPILKTVPMTEPTCGNVNSASEVPSNVFSTPTGNVYDKFCASLTLNNTHGLPVQGATTWAFDASGNKVPDPPSLKFSTRAMRLGRSIVERTPPPNPSAYGNDTFVLNWSPGNFGTNLCNRQCSEAYAEIVKSVCGHAGNAQTNMAQSSQIDVACGKYSVDIVKTWPPRGYREEKKRGSIDVCRAAFGVIDICRGYIVLL